MKKVISTLLAICVLTSLSACDNNTNPSTNTPPGEKSSVVNDTSATQTSASQDVGGTIETSSQDNANSDGDYVSSDSRIASVNFDKYWISDTQFDLINYCRDQGATIKYRIYADGSHNSYTYCLPEELTSTGQEPLAVIMFFYFGEEDSRSVSVECSICYGDCYTIKTETDNNILCLGPVETDDDYVWVTIDDFETHLPLSAINHLPIMFERIMTLPYNTSPEVITNTFNTYYGRD